MQVPTFLSNLSLWLAVAAIVLLSTSGFISKHSGGTNVLINRKRLRTVAVALGILFLVTAIAQMAIMMMAL